MKSKIIKVLAVVFVLIQFIRIDKTNPEIDKTQDFISIYKPNEAIANTLKSSCYDCHSSESTYPWYSNIAPVSWMVKHHIDEGREELNFSEWGTFTTKRKMKKLEEIVEEVEEGEMPMTPYVMIHSEAKMSDTERKAFLDFFKKLRK
jgi:hypothetical protein